MIPIKQMMDENSQEFYPVTHIDAVRDEQGRTVRDLVEGQGALNAAEVNEDGFFFVDEDLNIGCYVNATGVHAPSILEYELVND